MATPASTNNIGTPSSQYPQSQSQHQNQQTQSQTQHGYNQHNRRHVNSFTSYKQRLLQGNQNQSLMQFSPYACMANSIASMYNNPNYSDTDANDKHPYTAMQLPHLRDYGYDDVESCCSSHNEYNKNNNHNHHSQNNNNDVTISTNNKLHKQPKRILKRNTSQHQSTHSNKFSKNANKSNNTKNGKNSKTGKNGTNNKPKGNKQNQSASQNHNNNTNTAAKRKRKRNRKNNNQNPSANSNANNGKQNKKKQDGPKVIPQKASKNNNDDAMDDDDDDDIENQKQDLTNNKYFWDFFTNSWFDKTDELFKDKMFIHKLAKCDKKPMKELNQIIIMGIEDSYMTPVTFYNKWTTFVNECGNASNKYWNKITHNDYLTHQILPASKFCNAKHSHINDESNNENKQDSNSNIIRFFYPTDRLILPKVGYINNNGQSDASLPSKIRQTNAIVIYLHENCTFVRQHLNWTDLLSKSFPTNNAFGKNTNVVFHTSCPTYELYFDINSVFNYGGVDKVKSHISELFDDNHMKHNNSASPWYLPPSNKILAIRKWGGRYTRRFSVYCHGVQPENLPPTLRCGMLFNVKLHTPDDQLTELQRAMKALPYCID